MALVAFLMFCPQLLFIPPLQEAINRRTQRRIETLRELSASLVDKAANGAAVRSHHAFRRRIGFVYLLNVQIFVRKFGINFLMNLLYSIGVIGILAVGSWLVLHDRTEVGTIVAFISGLARMNAPWRDLMNWFRDLSNAGTKYRLIADELGKARPQPRDWKMLDRNRVTRGDRAVRSRKVTAPPIRPGERFGSVTVKSLSACASGMRPGVARPARGAPGDGVADAAIASINRPTVPACGRETPKWSRSAPR